jgi:hypothetical protein
MRKYPIDLTDSQWAKIARFFVKKGGVIADFSQKNTYL